jgi:hypothetical protein
LTDSGCCGNIIASAEYSKHIANDTVYIRTQKQKEVTVEQGISEVVYRADAERPLVAMLLQKREAIRRSLQELDTEIARVQHELSQRLEELQARRQPLEVGLQHVDALLRLEGWNEASDSGDGSPPQDQRLSPADAAFELLTRAGEPMHYKDIAGRLLEQGIPLPGRNPQATLLSYLARDERFKRAAKRGVYGLSEWRFRTAKPRRKRQRKLHK